MVARKRAHALGFSWLLKGWKGMAELPQAYAVQSSAALCLGSLYGMTVRPLVQRCDDTKKTNADNGGLGPKSQAFCKRHFSGSETVTNSIISLES